jgi:hypothetical protein
MCGSEGTEGSFVETAAKNGNCQISPLSFQRTVHQYTEHDPLFYDLLI